MISENDTEFMRMIEKAQERGLKIVMTTKTPTDKYDFLLDTQAAESLIHERFLSNLRTTKEEVTMSGICGDSFEVNQEVDLCVFTCLSSNEAAASVLSWVDVEDAFPYSIKSVPGKAFIVETNNAKVTFKNIGKRYIAQLIQMEKSLKQ